MLKQCIEVFKNELDEKGDKLIFDNYIPADGTYVIVQPEGDDFKIKDAINIKMDKKTRSIDRSSNNLYEICQYDYYSKYLESNKAIDPKKIIQSSNYLSFIIKKESLANGKVNNERIEEYYSILSDPEKKYSKSSIAKETYLTVEKEVGKVDVDRLNKIKSWIMNNIFNLPIDVSGKDYLKIFFEYPMSEYKKENKRYLIPNIYNKSDFNIKVDDVIYGLPNDNMGMNSKKPYLENKTRSNNVPYLIDDEEVLIQKELFDYLLTFCEKGKYNIYIDDKIAAYENGKLPERDFKGIFLRIQKGKSGAEIHSFDIITDYKPSLKKTFDFIEFINVDGEKDTDKKYGEYKTKKDIQILFDDILFSKSLINNYFTDEGDLDLKDSSVKRNLLTARGPLFNFLYKGISQGVYYVLEKVSISLVKDHIIAGFKGKAGKQFNMRWSIINYFKGGVKMADVVQDVKLKLREKINSDVTGRLESDDEYYFAIGQMVSYLLSKSKGKKKPHSLAASFINAKSDEKIREDLRKLFNKYSYDDSINGRRFNNLYAMILGYKLEDAVNQDMIIAGYLNNNLVYEKKEEN